MYTDDDLIQLSSVQHFLFCTRQCGLIHIEQVWDENLLTAEGRIMHDRAHDGQFEMRDGMRIERGMPLRSYELGLSGKADVIEFHRTPEGKGWTPFPVEYKHGKPKSNDCDKVQLCAQALCLEEMIETAVPVGAIFYGKIKRRLDVTFDERLRGRTKEAVKCLHEFLDAGVTPQPVYEKRCESCSLISVCMPKIHRQPGDVGNYIKKYIEK